MIEEAKQKIEIFISARSLKDMDTFSKSDPQVVLYVKNQQGKWQEFGRTEVVDNNLNPNFSKSFTIDYIFEIQQHIKFEVLDYDSDNSYDFIGDVQTTVSQVYGSKNGVCILPIKDGKGKQSGKLILHFESVEHSPQSLLSYMKVTKVKTNRWFSNAKPFLKLLKCKEDNSWLQVHTTNNLKDDHGQFNLLNIKLSKLCNLDYFKPIRVELWDYHNSGNHDLLGYTQFSLDQLINQRQINYVFKNKDDKQLGNLYFINPAIVNKYEFVDYVEGGLQINMIAAIDYTQSNGAQSHPSSLHYINQYQYNQYQQAIAAVGEILINYDNDKMVPVYGFGGKPHLPNLNTNTVSHCFPLTGDPNNAEVLGVQGILQLYQQSLQCIELYGPTLFGPIIKAAIEQSQQTYQLYRTQGIISYNVLLILTDGVIHDMDVCIDLLAIASNLPLSIIIIGVGNADFQQMEVLDGDNGLVTSQGQRVQRDLVQFVPFNSCSGNSVKLCKEVLAELPQQVCEYFASQNIWPQPKQQVNIQNMQAPIYNTNQLGKNFAAGNFLTQQMQGLGMTNNQQQQSDVMNQQQNSMMGQQENPIIGQQQNQFTQQFGNQMAQGQFMQGQINQFQNQNPNGYQYPSQ